MRHAAIRCLTVLIVITALSPRLGAQQIAPPSVNAATSPSSQAGPASPDSSGEFERLAKLAAEARSAARLNEAVALYQQALRLRPAWHEGWWNLGTILYSVDRLSEARDAFAHLVADLPQHGPSWAFLGLCEMQLREYERAVMDLDKARQLGLGDNQQFVQVTHYNLAILLNRFGRFEQAYTILKGFVYEAVEEPSIIEAMGLSTLRMPYLPEEVPPDKREMVLLAGRATYKMASTAFEDADKLFQGLLARYPGTPHLHYAYGVFLITWHYPEKGREEFRRELEVTPSHVPARLQIAQGYMFQGNYKEALPLAQEAIKLAPSSGNARSVLGRALLGTGDIKLAIRELETGVKLEPENPELHSLLARAYSKAGRKEESFRESAEFERLDKIRRRVQEAAPKQAAQTPQPSQAPPP